MKKYSILALALVLCVTGLTGCRRKMNVADGTIPNTTAATAAATHPTTMPTTEPTTDTTMMPGTDDMLPEGEDMIPGPEDTIDPTNGANNSTFDSRFKRSGF